MYEYEVLNMPLSRGFIPFQSLNREQRLKVRFCHNRALGTLGQDVERQAAARGGAWQPQSIMICLGMSDLQMEGKSQRNDAKIHIIVQQQLGEEYDKISNKTAPRGRGRGARMTITACRGSVGQRQTTKSPHGQRMAAATETRADCSPAVLGNSAAAWEHEDVQQHGSSRKNRQRRRKGAAKMKNKRTKHE
ncbi:hypothetical protein CDL15_Pgr021529 [Punica granatum]|uniref:Uncharacterized protein n=1 Tax=Punica granatum TaxID=22663 RepID=A0A218XQA7_PUNGR|nr:hypothetical protein CDL15_Pgr021529 [Punica granatum]